MAKQKQELAVIDFTQFSVAQLPELKGKKEEINSVIEANPIIEIKDNTTYELAKKSRTAVRTLRTSLESEQKAVKKRIKEHVLDVVDKEYDALVLDVKSAEQSRQSLIDVWEEKKEKERQEKARLEQERIDGIKTKISDYVTSWKDVFGLMKFEKIEEVSANFHESNSNFDKVALQEFDVLFDREISMLSELLDAKIKTLSEQEQIRLDNLLIQEKSAEQTLIQEWQRDWNANIDSLSVSDIADVKSVLVKSKLTNLKHYVSGYEEIYASVEKRLHSQIEFVSKAEEQRIAQEKLDREKKEFEQKQAEAKFQERCKQLTDLGFVLNESNGAYQKGLNYLNLEDIKSANDDLWIRELEDAKNVKDFSEIGTVDASAQEVEVVAEEVIVSPVEMFETMENLGEEIIKFPNHNASEFANNNAMPAEIKEGKIFSGETQEVESSDVTWSRIYQEWDKHNHPQKEKSSTWLIWLQAHYNAPTKKQ